MSAVIAYEPEEMIIRVRGDISLREMNDALAEHSQWIPTLVANEHPDATLALAVENDRYHPRAARCGMLRTTILGGEFMTTGGKRFKSGSRVVKSVAGYDIHRAFCGSRGAFGIIESLTLKVLPKPEHVLHFLIDASLQSAVMAMYPTIIEPYDGSLFCELAGFSEDIVRDEETLSHLVTDRPTHELSAHIICDIILSHPLAEKETPLLHSLIEAFAAEG